MIFVNSYFYLWFRFLSNFNFTSGVPHGICDLPNLEFL